MTFNRRNLLVRPLLEQQPKLEQRSKATQSSCSIRLAEMLMGSGSNQCKCLLLYLPIMLPKANPWLSGGNRPLD